MKTWVYLLLKNIKQKLFRLKLHYLYFILPNRKVIKSGNLKYKSVPQCNQRLYITGLGKLYIGDRCVFGYKPGGRFYKGAIEIQARTKEASIHLGNNIFSNNNLFICSAGKITIGDNTLIGEGVTIMDFEAHGMQPDMRRKMGVVGEVVIGNNVWIGNVVTILKNTEIGDNSIVAAGAVVSGKFPPNVIIGGVPAKLIKTL